MVRRRERSFRLPGILSLALALALGAGLATSDAAESAAPAGAGGAADGAELRGVIEKIDRTLAKSVGWLRKQQNTDGGYGPTQINPLLRGTSDLGLTAFALYAVARSPARLRDRDDRSVKDALKFILERQQSDGGFRDLRDPSLAEYKTSVALLALVTLDREKYSREIARARDFIKSRQFTETQGFSRESPYYGGFGYDGTKANLSVTKYTTEALHEAGLSSADSVWERVQVYLGSTQNSRGEVDPRLKKLKVGTTGDGGFRYGSDFTRGPERTLKDGTRLFSSYGSMTYAGLLSFLHARVDRRDPRVRQAFDWISKNFTVQVNPGMATLADPELGLQGLYYYYHTMAKALSTYGEPFIVDENGVRHDWARELGEHLVKAQKPDGFWVNSEDRWMEAIPVLSTCYATLALSMVRDELGKRVAGKGAAPESEKKREK